MGEVDKDTYFISHSIGCQTILRYLENLPFNKIIGGAIFVAGWFTLMNLQKKEEGIAKPWLESLINFSKVKQHTNNFFAVFSDNDDVVPFKNRVMFEKNLNAKTVLERKMGHFSGGDKIKELPIVLEKLLEMSK